MAFRVPAAEGEETVDYLFEREMLTGVYHATWRSAETAQGAIRVMAFVVDRAHRQYVGRLGHDAMVALILQGCGDRGPCLEYLENTVHQDRKSTRLNSITNAHLVCRLLLEKKKNQI